MTQSRTKQPVTSPLNDAARVSSAMGDFCSSFAWDFFATLTADDDDRRGHRHRRPVTEHELQGEVGRMVRRLTASAQRPVSFVMAYQSIAGGHGHVHALLGDCGNLSIDRVRSAWKGGRSDVQRYDSTKGGAYYVPRFAGVDPDQMQFSATMPPRLRLELSGADCTSVDDEGEMIELMSGETRAKTGRVVPVTRVLSVESVDLDAVGAFMAKLLLRHAGLAA